MDEKGMREKHNFGSHHAPQLKGCTPLCDRDIKMNQNSKQHVSSLFIYS
jgi:hypothetical protein